MFSPEVRMSSETKSIHKDLDYVPGRERSLKKMKNQFVDKAGEQEVEVDDDWRELEIEDQEQKSVERVQDYAMRRRAQWESGTTLKDSVMDTLTLQNDKIQLIQALNKRLVELDGINEDKRRLNDELIETIRTVRELQAQLGTADNSNVHDVGDKQVEAQLRFE